MARKRRRRTRRRDDWRKAKIDWNGHPKIPPVTRAQRRLRKMLRWVQHFHPEVYVTSTHDGVHASRSLHGQWSPRRIFWKAVDLGSSSTENKVRVQNGIFNNFPHEWFAEFFGPANYPWISGGHVFTASEGSGIETQHDTHVHAGLR